MRIEAYFQQIQSITAACSFIQLSNVTYEKRGTYEGFIRGELHFVDDSVLHLREFVDVEAGGDRLMYAYQYMKPSNNMVFRYDNTGHHKKSALLTYPHHKHEGSEETVLPCSAMDLDAVLQEIELLVQLP